MNNCNDNLYDDISYIIKDYDIITFDDIDNQFILVENIHNEDNINYMSFNHNNINNVITFDMNDYLTKILESYKYNKDHIYDQFMKDFYRKESFLDNEKCKDHDFFINYVTIYSFFKININNKIMELNYIILSLFTQSSLALPFKLINEIYTNEKNNLFVTFRHSNDLKYRITESDSLINIKIDAILDITNINTGEKKNFINVVMNIDILFKDNNYVFPKLGIIYWNLNNY